MCVARVQTTLKSQTPNIHKVLWIKNTVCNKTANCYVHIFVTHLLLCFILLNVHNKDINNSIAVHNWTQTSQISYHLFDSWILALSPFPYICKLLFFQFILSIWVNRLSKGVSFAVYITVLIHKDTGTENS